MRGQENPDLTLPNLDSTPTTELGGTAITELLSTIIGACHGT